MNDQFCSVFFSEDQEQLPEIPGDPAPSIPNLEISLDGVTKLLTNLNSSKAVGPDKIPNQVLKYAAKDIAPYLRATFTQSLTTGELPDDWVKANIAPAYKKGNRHLPANYRPISLTCVCAKLLEHIICKHMLNHFDRHRVLTPLQHGFQARHSCETQLLLTSTDLVQNYENKLQTDVIVLDFSKAFDVVAHQRPLHKLKGTYFEVTRL